MTARQLRAWRLRLGLTQEVMARWLGVGVRTLKRWEGGAGVSDLRARAVHLLHELYPDAPPDDISS